MNEVIFMEQTDKALLCCKGGIISRLEIGNLDKVNQEVYKSHVGPHFKGMGGGA